MKQDVMSFEIVKVTPTLARKWLEQNHDSQREIQWGRVEAFTQDILRGAWELTHQGICFDKNEKLIDGQHRLHAVIKADKAVEMAVVHNRRGKFIAPIDRGQPRSLALISGRSRREVATINMLRNFEVGQQVTTPITLEDVNQYGDHHKDAFTRFSELQGHSRLHAGVAAALIWTLPIDEAGVLGYSNFIITGEALYKGDPALVFRRWQERKLRVRPSNYELALATFNCLRYYLAELKLKSVYTGESGYRAITAQRRKMKIPFTPGVDKVKGLRMKPSLNEAEDEAASDE